MSVAKLWDDDWVGGEMPIELGASWLSTKAIKVAHQKVKEEKSEHKNEVVRKSTREKSHERYGTRKTSVERKKPKNAVTRKRIDRLIAIRL